MPPMGQADTIASASGAGLCGLSRRTRLAVLWIAAATTVGAVFAHRMNAPAYNVFADHVTCLGIPNFTNVASNLAFVAVGLVVLVWLWAERSRLLGTRFRNRTEIALYASFFAAAILVGLGSADYHYAPTNATLFWDRVPMTFAVAALTGAFLAERVDCRTGVVVGIALALFLPGTLVYWLASEAAAPRPLAVSGGSLWVARGGDARAGAVPVAIHARWPGARRPGMVRIRHAVRQGARRVGLLARRRHGWPCRQAPARSLGDVLDLLVHAAPPPTARRLCVTPRALPTSKRS